MNLTDEQKQAVALCKRSHVMGAVLAAKALGADQPTAELLAKKASARFENKRVRRAGIFAKLVELQAATGAARV